MERSTDPGLRRRRSSRQINHEELTTTMPTSGIRRIAMTLTISSLIFAGTAAARADFSYHLSASFIGANGSYPQCGLTAGPNDNLYGTAIGGGTAGAGALVSYSPSTQ